jgi:hypothetical protein
VYDRIDLAPAFALEQRHGAPCGAIDGMKAQTLCLRQKGRQKLGTNSSSSVARHHITRSRPGTQMRVSSDGYGPESGNAEWRPGVIDRDDAHRQIALWVCECL